MTQEELEALRTETIARRAAYVAQEEKILTGGVQAYGVGSRSLTRYNTDLAEVRKAINELQEQIDEINSKLSGGAGRRTQNAIFGDW